MAWSFFQRKPNTTSANQLPKDSYIGLQFETDGSPDVWVVNQALIGFTGKALFPWHLSMIIEMSETAESGLPTRAEQQVLGKLGEELGANLKANGNSVFVASGSWKGTRQLFYQVRGPDAANAYLQDFVANPAAIRAMEFRMDEDPTWSNVGKLLDAARGVQN